MGETPKNVAALFKVTRDEGAVLLFDEADAIASRRSTSVDLGFQRESNTVVSVSCTNWSRTTASSSSPSSCGAANRAWIRGLNTATSMSPRLPPVPRVVATRNRIHGKPLASRPAPPRRLRSHRPAWRGWDRRSLSGDGHEAEASSRHQGPPIISRRRTRPPGPLPARSGSPGLAESSDYPPKIHRERTGAMVMASPVLCTAWRSSSDWYSCHQASALALSQG